MAEPVLQTLDISKSFGALRVSQSISIDLQAAEIHAVIGPNGAGKTTLIKQICGGLMPDAGDIFLDGQRVTDLGTGERARWGLGRTFQISALSMQDTVLQNVILASVAKSGSKPGLFSNVLSQSKLVQPAMEALDWVGLNEKAQMKTSELSHGERRQLEVAIAITLKPKAFIMDEPMAGLGAEGSKRLTALLGELKLQAPILLVEHDMDAVFALADRISVLVYGKVIATGSVEEIRANAQVQEAYLGENA